jgi:hypothetical protein
MGTGRQQMLWRVMADIVVAVHATYVAIVVVGLAAILIGSAAQWRWVQNFCFRAAHLGDDSSGTRRGTCRNHLAAHEVGE